MNKIFICMKNFMFILCHPLLKLIILSGKKNSSGFCKKIKRNVRGGFTFGNENTVEVDYFLAVRFIE
jgi:hypothetical protein